MTLRLPRLDGIHARLRRFFIGCSLRPELRVIASTASELGTPAHLVGGVVRDALLGSEAVADCDLIVPRGALALARAAAPRLDASFVLLDEERGVARLVRGGSSPLQLDIADYQRPTLHDDLRARDLSINAMAVALDEALGEGTPRLVDPCGGAADLCGALIRTPSPSSLDDDPLRLLRAVRFAATLDFRLDRGTREAVQARAPLLAAVAFERVRDELFKLLEVDDAYPHVETLRELGLLTVIVPELGPLDGLAQTSQHHHLGVLEHTLLALKMLEEEALPLAHSLLEVPALLRDHLEGLVCGPRSRLALLKLGTLLHDVGKPAARRLRDDGTVSFRGHEAQGCEPARQAGERLRLSSDEITLLTAMVRCHLLPFELPPAQHLRGSELRRYFTQAAPAGVETLVLALADQEASRGPATTPELRRELRERVRRLLAWSLGGEGAASAQPLVSGKVVMRELDLAPGPAVGAWIERLLDAQADGLISSPEQALAWLVRTASEDGPAAVGEASPAAVGEASAVGAPASDALPPAHLGREAHREPKPHAEGSRSEA